ncbi:MAG TPA: hypothetical protein VF662_09580 [Allosphingosinicella sp.]|jgi:DNA-directed RNA polymerase specialized sigma24 family protein
MDEVEYHTIEEVKRALARLRDPTLVKLTMLARSWIRMTPQRGHEDLLSEALSRVLSGRRRWPLGLPLDVFLNGVMRSIASQWVGEDAARATIGLEDAVGVASPGGAGAFEFRDAVARMSAILAFDPLARGILEGAVEGSTCAEIMDNLGMDETAYDTARRRMVRVLAKAFGPDWKDKI